MLKLFRYIKKYWWSAILAPTFMAVEVLMDMLLTKKMAVMVDSSIHIGTDAILETGLQMMGIVFLGVISGISSGVFTNITSFHFANELRKDLYKKIMELSYDQTDKFQTGSLVTRVTNDVTQIQNFLSMALRGLIRAFSFFVMGIIFTLSISDSFGIVLAIVLPLELLTLIVFSGFIFPMFSILQKKLDSINSIVHENVTGARVVKAFGKEEYECNRFNNGNEDYSSTLLKISKITSLLIPLLSIMLEAGIIAIYYIGGTAILDFFESVLPGSPRLLIGEISSAITYIVMVVNAMLMLGMTFSNMARASASAKRINEVLDCKLEIFDGGFDLKNKKEAGTIEFRDVSFAYPGSPNPVIKDLNFKINQGEVVAIVGSTGSGKSSLVNLIPRFYDVNSGEVLVDGINVKDYKLVELRDIISIALQKSELFAGTMKENILWGKPDATFDEVYEAAEISQALEAINSKPDKFDSYVEEKGTSLSGGQKQRLSIARAIVKKPEILIFDDATSALDLVTEAKLYKELREKMGNVTKIIVAQRIATAKQADKIIVLDNGTINAFDTHENLMKNCPVYQDIYNSQLKREGDFFE